MDEKGEGGEAGEGKSMRQGPYTRLGFVCERETEIKRWRDIEEREKERQEIHREKCTGTI